VAAEDRIEVFRYLWDQETLRATDGDALWVGTARAHGLERLASDGRSEVRVRWDGPDLTVTEADRARHFESRIAAAEREGDTRAAEGLRVARDRQPHAPTFPAYDAVVADAGGGVWVREFRRPDG